jgi:signal transduction histidine kinase
MQENLEGSKTGQPFNMEYRLITKDQRVIWVKDEANLVKDEHSQPQYWLGVWTDITDRKHAEEEQADLVSVMTKRTIQLQTAAEVSRAASSILDLNKLLPAVVELICSHFDYYYVGIFLVEESKEWAILSAASGKLGKQMLETHHRLKVEDSSMIGWCIKHGQARIALDVGEDAVRFKNPNLPLTRSEMALPLITRGEVIGAMTIQSQLPSAFTRVDITALQTMADQVANAIKNARLFTERVNLNKELEEQNAELERFTYTVSHDLKSPLVTIRGFLGYLRQDAESGDMIRFDKDLHRIANAVDKMQALLNDLLELSRIGRIINPPEKIPFGQIVAEAIELLNGPLEKNNVRAVVQEESFPSILGDHARLVEVMQNLISNAAKFMGEQPHPIVEIGTAGMDADHKIIFYVRDNGIGIDPQYHERIFGLFNRLDPNITGTGIGLTLVKRIIEIHNGRIWVDSRLGEGATFYFTLPQE